MRGEKVALGGAVAAAAAASACCVGPLLFVVLGLGTFGAATAFEAARPYMLAASVLLLAFGFYRTYFRREMSCAPDGHCTTKPTGRFGRAALWLSAAAVLAFALSPYYAGTLASRFGSSRAAGVPAGQLQAAPPAADAPTNARATFKVTGMTCGSCETTIRLALERTPGVRGAEVSYPRGEAVVDYDPAVATPEKLRDAINGTGYKAEQSK